jgi:hypothetical protein
MRVECHGLPGTDVEIIRRCGQGSNGDPVERHASAEEGGMPCLALAHRPFRT